MPQKLTRDELKVQILIGLRVINSETWRVGHDIWSISFLHDLKAPAICLRECVLCGGQFENNNHVRYICLPGNIDGIAGNLGFVHAKCIQELMNVNS